VTPLVDSTPQGNLRIVSGFILICTVTLTAACTVVGVAVFAFHLSVRPVLTGSMRPAYGPGALLITRPVPVRDLHKGMIVLFVPPGEHAEFAHRITSVSGTSSAPVITTKGDANEAPDPWHAQLTSTSVPQVVATVPWFGRFMVGIRGPIQLMLIVLGGLAVGTSGVRWILSPREVARPLPSWSSDRFANAYL
jgi:signal peptidase I